jgi:hypothetical protein
MIVFFKESLFFVNKNFNQLLMTSMQIKFLYKLINNANVWLNANF